MPIRNNGNLVMKIKEGVNMSGLKIEMRPVIMVADKIWDKHLQELVITSATEGTHSPGSLHYYGYALDLRTRYFDEIDKYAVTEELKYELTKRNKLYRVVVHKTHIHIEYRGAIV